MKKGGKIALGVVGVLALCGIVGNIRKSDDDKDSSSKISTTIDSSVEKTSEDKTEPSTKATEAPTEAETTKATEENTEQSGGLSIQEIKDAVNNGDYSLVTPEFKDVMDSYEAFYDEYIEFMKKYTSDTANMLTMLDDYNKMLTQLDEWSAKMDAYDMDSLSPADSAYYLLVTLRVEKKMLEQIGEF